MSGTVAIADAHTTDIDGGGGSVQVPASVAPETQQSRDKLALANALRQKIEAARSGTTVRLDGASKSSASYDELLAGYASTYGASAVPSGLVVGAQALSTGATTQSFQVAKALSVTWAQQQKYYYCGPATAYMTFKFIGKTTGAKDGVSLTQAHLASSTYLKTEANTETSTRGNNMNYGMNLWRSGANTGYYVRSKVTSQSQLEDMFILSISGNEPFAVSTGESADGPHYNNHPVSHTIGHWVTGIGYTDNGGHLSMMDPAAGLANYESSAKIYVPTSSSFYKFTANRFSVW